MAARLLEALIVGFDRTLRTVSGVPQSTAEERPVPQKEAPSAPRPGLGEARHLGRLMRVNYAGEVAAQGLYLGQRLTARSPAVAAQMEKGAQEEQDHLNWCINRMQDHGIQPSLLNPLWLAGSMTLGAAAGLAGDRWSLGFVMETEHQVMCHLQGHLAQVPDNEPETRAILEQMYLDERHHAEWAEEGGGQPLPLPIRIAMSAGSKLLTTGSYWL